jgi:carbon-monoxide dehydrogenase large subunit
MQGIGQILGEHCIYEHATGQLLTGTFMDYYMPRAQDLPALSLHHRPVASPSNPLGVKGTGEAGTTGAVPALANAVMDALAGLGIHELDTPFTPFRVWSALRAARTQAG